MAQRGSRKGRAELAYVSRATSLGALTASIAHEVNQPLSGIVTNAGTCLRMLDAAPPDIDGARETARRTIRDGNRASDVITRLRALFSKREFTLEPVDLNEATRELIALSLNELQRNRVILQSELAEGLPTVTGDRVQLQQVILNLVRNASDAMVDVHDRPRQLLIKTEREDGNRVRLTVRDAGVGLGRRTWTQCSMPSTPRRAEAWASGCLSAARSSRDIRVVFGQSRMMDQVPLSRFPFPFRRHDRTTATSYEAGDESGQYQSLIDGRRQGDTSSASVGMRDVELIPS